MAAFVGICFHFGNGSFSAGVSSASAYLLILGFGLIILACVVGMIAFFAGRFIGTTVSAAIAFCLLITITTMSYTVSKPLSRFRKLIWTAAPESLSIHHHQMLRSFNDGTDYTFVIKTESQTIEKLCHAAKLSKVAQPFGMTISSLPGYFPETTFPRDTAFYQGDKIALAYRPSDQTAFLVWSPAIQPIDDLQ